MATKQIEATPKTVKDIGKWLRENLFLVRDDGAAGKFSRVLTRQLVKGSKRGEEVFYLDVPKRAGEDWCDTTALEIYTRLQMEASTLGGLQKYALYAYCAGDTENHVSRFVLRIQGADDEDDNDMLSETPDRTGLVSQSMRHSEAQQKINVSLVMTTQAAQSQLIARQGAMLEKLMEMRFASMEREEELITRKHEREIELLQAESKAKVIKEIGGKLGLFVPALMNKMAGQQLFPVQANAVLMMTKGLLTGIASDEGRMNQLMSILKPEEAVAFMNILEEVSRKVDDAGLPVDTTQTNGATATQETKG